MTYGDVYWVKLPDRKGHEERGQRPAIIFQDMISFGTLPTVLIIPLTASLSSLRFPATLRIDRTATNGLKTVSVALVFQLGACDKRRIEQPLGKLDDADLQAVQDMAKRLQLLP